MIRLLIVVLINPETSNHGYIFEFFSQPSFFTTFLSHSRAIGIMALTSSRPKTVLFDEPTLEIRKSAKSIHVDEKFICCGQKLKISLLIYMLFLICQYILAFAAVPFDDIENRPPIHLISNFFILFMVCCYRWTSRFR